MIYEGKTVVGVKLENETLYADKVVVNADFAHAMSTLVPDEKRKKWSNKKLEKKGYSCSTFMLYLGMDKTIRCTTSSPNLRITKIRRKSQ